jgi:hypothetical protein
MHMAFKKKIKNGTTLSMKLQVGLLQINSDSYLSQCCGSVKLVTEKPSDQFLGLIMTSH